MSDALRERVRSLPRPLLAGLSGGADSVALLLALAEENPAGLTAVHVNHGLRGAAADGDEAFCAALCRRLGVPLRVRRLSLPPGCGEDTARLARYRAFAEAAEETGCRAIALAHHMDDQAETLLLRLLRGSGGRGLAGLAPEGEAFGLRILRPLLDCSHRELCAWLEERGQPWREDDTNGEDIYLRNRVRHRLIPLMEDLNPGAARRLARTAQLLREDEEALTGWALGLTERASGPLWLRLDGLNDAPPAVTGRALRHWWERSPANRGPEHSLSLEQTRALAGLLGAAPGSRCNLPSGWRGERGARFLHLLAPAGETPEPVPARDGAAFGGLTLRVTPWHGEQTDGRTAAILSPGLLSRCVVRTGRPGDRITPVNSGRSRPLREYLRSRGTEPGFRPWLPLLCEGGRVIMAPGLGRGEAEHTDSGAERLLLRWTGPMPWLDTDPEEDGHGTDCGALQGPGPDPGDQGGNP